MPGSVTPAGFRCVVVDRPHATASVRQMTDSTRGYSPVALRAEAVQIAMIPLIAPTGAASSAVVIHLSPLRAGFVHIMMGTLGSAGRCCKLRRSIVTK